MEVMEAETNENKWTMLEILRTKGFGDSEFWNVERRVKESVRMIKIA